MKRKSVNQMVDLKKILRNQHQNINTREIRDVKRHGEWSRKCLYVYKRIPEKAN